jgi:hypothetical protein
VFATIGDLSTLLAMSDRGVRDQLYALLRRAFDGSVTREVGNAPEPLHWQGRLTLLAAVTPQVDRYAAHADALGPRWLCLRLPPADERLRREASRKSRSSASDLRAHRARVRDLATRCVRAAVAQLHRVHLSDSLGEQLDDAALLACLGRADVPRDGYGRREIIGIATVEEPPRLTGQLAKLARGALALGLDEQATGDLCRRAALDSMPLARRGCLHALAEAPKGSVRAIARRAGCHRHVADRALEDLAEVDLAAYEEPADGEPFWRLAEPHAALVQGVLHPKQVGTKSRDHTPNPQGVKGDALLFVPPPDDPAGAS